MKLGGQFLAHIAIMPGFVDDAGFVDLILGIAEKLVNSTSILGG